MRPVNEVFAAEAPWSCLCVGACVSACMHNCRDFSKLIMLWYVVICYTVIGDLTVKRITEIITMLFYALTGMSLQVNVAS